MRKFLGRRLARKKDDLAAVAHAQRGGDALVELKLDALQLMTKSTSRSRYSPALAGDALGEFGKLRAFGLAHIEDIGGAEPNQNGLILSADVLLGLFVLLAANADHGSKNADAVLALLDLAAKLVPRIQASNAGCVRLLPCNLQNVAKAVVVKPAHCVEVGGEGFAVSLLQLLDEGLHVGRDYFFRGLRCCCLGWWWTGGRGC